MKRALALVLLLIVCSALVSGCFTQALNLYKNATFGARFYNYDNVDHWRDTIVMSASGVNSTWNMTMYVKNDTLNGTDVRYMRVITEGNGVNITYDVWFNKTTYDILRMHAKGTTGDFYQDKDVSKMQIYTIADVGLSYYFVPFWPAKNISVKSPDGKTSNLTVYSATDNKGFTVMYWIHPQVPVPVKVEMIDKNYTITETLQEYK